VAAGSLNLAGCALACASFMELADYSRCAASDLLGEVSPLQKILSRRDGFSFSFTQCEVESHTSGEPPAIMAERPNCSYDRRYRQCFVFMPLLSRSRVRQFANSRRFETGPCKLLNSQNSRTGFASGGDRDEIYPAQRDDRGKVAFAFDFDHGSEPGLGPEEQK
jgi:hypothetical protein